MSAVDSAASASGVESHPHYPRAASVDALDLVVIHQPDTPGEIRHTGREKGADTDAILCGELGMTPERVAELRERGVVA